jgi:pimeloyl-ACP methyl ester carboxylesterase
MATYVLIHGAGSGSWYWHLVVPELEALGHRPVAVDLPCDDDDAGFEEYAEAVVGAVGDPGGEVIVVAQSLAGFTAPMVCGRLPVVLLVLVNAMVPRPGESAGEWWANTRHVFPDPFDPEVVFTHDLPPDLAAESARHLRRQSDIPFQRPWPLERWPDVATRVLVSRDDRFFPADFQRRVARQRLGIVPDEMEGGHLPALARPHELVRRLEEYRTNLRRP